MQWFSEHRTDSQEKLFFLASQVYEILTALHV